MNAASGRIITGKYLVPAAALAVVSVVNVILEGHVEIQADQLSTYASIFQHKCGIAMLGCLAWTGLEAVGMLTHGREVNAPIKRHRKSSVPSVPRQSRRMV